MAEKSASRRMAEATVTSLPMRRTGLDDEINTEIREQVLERLRNLRTAHLTEKEFAMILYTYTRIQYGFVSLRKEKWADPNAGVAVRKYEAAFKASPARRKTNAGPPEPELPEPDDPADDLWGADDDPE